MTQKPIAPKGDYPMPMNHKELFPAGIIKEITMRTTGWPSEDGEVLLRDATTDFTAHEPKLIVDSPGIPPGADVMIIRDERYNFVTPYGSILFLTCRYRKKSGRVEFKTLFNIQSDDNWFAGQLHKVPSGKEIRNMILTEIQKTLEEREN